MKRLKKMVEQVVCLLDGKLTQILLMFIGLLTVKHEYWLEMGGRKNCKKAQDIMLIIRYLDVLSHHSRVLAEFFVLMGAVGLIVIVFALQMIIIN